MIFSLSIQIHRPPEFDPPFARAKFRKNTVARSAGLSLGPNEKGYQMVLEEEPTYVGWSKSEEVDVGPQV